MNPVHGDPPNLVPESFQVDTQEVAAIERLREAEIVNAPPADGLASLLCGLWDRIHAAPNLARLVRINAELRNHPSPRPAPLQLIHGDDPSEGSAEAVERSDLKDSRGIDPL